LTLLRRPRGAAASFARTPRAADSTPWRQAPWCAIDLELTGLDPRKDAVIAIGAVPIEDGRLLLGRSVYTLARTSRRSEHTAILMHKLRVADLADAPLPEEAIDVLFDALAGRVPVFHTAWVERSFLGPLFAKRRVRLPRAADTQVLGDVWLRRRGQQVNGPPSLETLAAELGVRPEPAHHALGDALTTATAFIALAAHLDAVQPQTVGSLVWANDELRAPRRLVG
jgi:DNA polymerase III subunit epsilon